MIEPTPDCAQGLHLFCAQRLLLESSGTQGALRESKPDWLWEMLPYNPPKDESLNFAFHILSKLSLEFLVHPFSSVRVRK